MPPFAALADPTRQQIIELLARGEQPVNRIARGFDMSRPAVSQHLRVLLRAGLVHERRAGRERIYSLEPAALESVAAWATLHAALGRSRAAAPSASPAPKPPAPVPRREPAVTHPSPPSSSAPAVPRRPRIRRHDQ